MNSNGSHKHKDLNGGSPGSGTIRRHGLVGVGVPVGGSMSLRLGSKVSHVQTRPTVTPCSSDCGDADLSSPLQHIVCLYVLMMD